MFKVSLEEKKMDSKVGITRGKITRKGGEKEFFHLRKKKMGNWKIFT